MRRMKGFTLIELLVVVAIIGFLAATLVVAARGLQARARIERADSLVRRLSTGCAAYFEAYRDFPSTQVKLTAADKAAGKTWTPVKSTTLLYDALGRELPLAQSFSGATSSIRKVGPFAEIADSEIKGPLGGPFEILDPWGNAVTYELPGFSHGANYPDTSAGPVSSTDSGFDITSAGPDGKAQTLTDKLNTGWWDDRANWIIDRK